VEEREEKEREGEREEKGEGDDMGTGRQTVEEDEQKRVSVQRTVLMCFFHHDSLSQRRLRVYLHHTLSLFLSALSPALSDRSLTAKVDDSAVVEREEHTEKEREESENSLGVLTHRLIIEKLLVMIEGPEKKTEERKREQQEKERRGRTAEFFVWIAALYHSNVVILQDSLISKVFHFLLYGSSK
jgi:hypothetical protein